ncbi:hypothetical protein H8K35_11210 [Undibacterium sp. LX40W]|uniref:Sel1 repeat family protein n=1 Tax=Undibacterium nitidum TaxID=2762298 RepID=A0A923HMH6_9BURK|nr:MULTISPECIES: hypothetical protein [Undibacterium]MBC3881772.1 hypothetical protein [Undibacterium nitidum]MBC3892231.1 hypothetical protein [Undibacterium sp. LX40W]
MNKLNIALAAVGVLLAGSSYVFWQSLNAQEQQELAVASRNAATGKDKIESPSSLMHEAGNHSHSQGNLANPWQASPFQLSGDQVKVPDFGPIAKLDPTKVPEPEREVVSAEELARRKKMSDLGYMVPTDYYTKDLKTLKQLAKSGDAYAMVHLGEKYYFELNGQTNNPEFEQGVDYPAAAKQSFKDALVAGNVRSAGIIAELYFQEKNSTEAYAWHLISDQLGDDISANWFRRTDMAQQATPQIKQAAAARAAQIMSELKLTKKSS